LTVVAFESVAKTFGSGKAAVVAVHDATGQVGRTDRIALLGRSGSGKSTLLALLAGLELPSAGSIRWPGAESAPRGDAAVVATVFQGGSLVPALTAAENVALPAVLQGLPDREARQRAVEAMDRVGVSDLAERLPDELSGGQVQRLAVARVLTTKPQLILADEPTGRLDRAAAATVMDVLLFAADDLGAGLLVATHDLDVASRLSIRWQISDGGLVVRAR
jgi:putative ABC transport system ATP-binding protein